MIRILHIDSSATWGGGQSQISTLINESQDRDVGHYLASPKSSPLWFKTRSRIRGFCPLARASSNSIVAMLRVASFCKRNQIQIIHAHCGKSHSFAFWLKTLFLPNIKLVVHRRIPAKIRSHIFSKMKFKSSKVDQFITVSDYIRTVLVSGGVESSKITVIRSTKKPFSCGDEDKIRARERLILTPGLAQGGDFFIVSASRLVEDKGLFVLIDGFRQFHRENSRARLLIAGEGPLEQKLKVAARSLIEQGVVSFLGFRKDVPKLLLGADVLAMPSLSEGLGSTIIESMFARTSVIASGVEGIPELITDGSTGLLVAPHDAEGLARAFSNLYMSPDLRHRLAENAYRWALEACAYTQMIDKTLQVYENLLNGSLSPHPLLVK